MLARPCAVAGAFRASIAAAVGIIDGERGLQVVHSRAPALQGDGGLHRRCRLGEFPARVVLIELQSVARAVEDEHAFGACGQQHFVHGWGHLAHALGGIGAMVLVPHIAHHHGGSRGLPGHGAVVGSGCREVGRSSAPARVQGDGFGLGAAVAESEHEANPSGPPAGGMPPRIGPRRSTGDHSPPD